MDAEKLFERMVGKGILQRAEYGQYGTPVPSLGSYIAAKAGSVLHLIALDGNSDSVKPALVRGEDPNAIDIRGRMPLHIAAGCDWADPEASDLKGRRPIELLPNHANARLR